MTIPNQQIADYLAYLNTTYMEFHQPYEEAFWKSYMGDKNYDQEYIDTKQRLDAFKESRDHAARVDDLLQQATSRKKSDIGDKDDTLQELISRLQRRQEFFVLYQTPADLQDLKIQITQVEKAIETAKTNRAYGYTDPTTGEQVTMSPSGMLMRMRTDDDERVRKACWEGIEATVDADVEQYVELVKLRNTYARALGYPHFYEYKAQLEERMSAQEIWDLFDELREQAEPAYAYVRELEKTRPWLREPWNYGYMMTGSFTQQEDPYLPLSQTVRRRVQSMAACNVSYRGATMVLDLLERDGKYNNGFCHMPKPVRYRDGQRQAAQINFTCTAIPGQIGDGHSTGVTLFHEGGHAAHFAHMDCQDVILNTEYPPGSTARAETQSMFLDTMYSSIERKTRYATNAAGERYPRSLYEKKTHQLQPLALKSLMGIAMIVEFERRVYLDPDLTPDKVKAYAHACSERYLDYTHPFHFALLPVHLYSWESACAYNGYGLASLAVAQWREWWYTHDGYIVDNPNLGPVMQSLWALGSSRSFQECLIAATGKPLSVDAYVQQARLTAEQKLARDRQRIEHLQTIPTHATGACSLTGQRIPQLETPIELDAHIRIVHGDEVIADSQEGGYIPMADRFAEYITQHT